jgi:membrane protein
VFSLFIDIKKLSLEFKIFLIKHLAAGAGSAVGKHIDVFLSKIQFKTLGYVGFLVLLLVALLLLASIEDAINRIWAIQKRKALWKRFLIYNLILFIGPVSVSLSLATTTIFTKFFPQFVVKANMWVILINTLFVTLTYKIFPNKKVSWWAALVAGFLVAITCETAKWGYTAYVTKLLFVNKIYGSVAAMPLLLIWLYLNWLIFLGGALLSFMIQHRKAWKAEDRNP